MRRHVAVGLMVGLVATAACADGDNDLTDTSAGQLGDSAAAMVPGTDGPMRDSDIFASLTASNAGEVTLGQLAQERATDAEVKEFANMMVTDHNAMNEEVHQVAQQLNLTSQVGDRAEDVVDNSNEWAEDLRDETGADFDKKYMDIMVEAHENTLEMLDRAASSTTTQQLTTSINNARPKVQAHLDRAKQIRDRLNNTNQ